jgi:uncharacterized protein (TIGR02268 family)
MSLASSALLLLLASPPDIEVRRPYPDACEESARSIALSTESAWGSIEVCTSAELSTTFVFDSEVARVVLQDEEEFRRVDVDEGTLVLVPRRKSRLWKPSRMTVHFEGEAAPASVTFLLVPHPARLARQVEVFRFARPEEPCEREVWQLREENASLAQEVERLRAETRGQGSLTRLFTTGRMNPRNQGVVASDLSKSITRPPAETFKVEDLVAYHYPLELPEDGEPMFRMALVLRLENVGTRPWKTARASLVRDGVEVRPLEVWQPEPLAPKQRGLLILETELPEREAREKLTLQLWDEDGARSVTIGNVGLPSAEHLHADDVITSLADPLIQARFDIPLPSTSVGHGPLQGGSSDFLVRQERAEQFVVGPERAPAGRRW